MAKKHRSAKDLKRHSPKRNPYDRVLIVCEGEKTEPNYFEEIRQHLKLPTANILPVQARSTQPLKIVDYALDHFLKSGRVWDHVYCVFDRDEHPEYCNAIAKADNISLKNDEKRLICFRSVPSNPCFELWLLLHFQDQQSHQHRHVTQRQLKEPHIPNYEKGQKGAFQETFVVDNGVMFDQACSRAIELRRRCHENGVLHDNPSTDVDILVKLLLGLKGLK